MSTFGEGRIDLGVSFANRGLDFLEELTRRLKRHQERFLPEGCGLRPPAPKLHRFAKRTAKRSHDQVFKTTCGVRHVGLFRMRGD